MITIEPELVKLSKSLSNEGLQLTVKGEAIESRMFVVNKFPRPAFRVGSLLSFSVNWCSVNRSLFEKSSNLSSEIPVFIQSHALKRMEERLDSIAPCHSYGYVFISLEKPKVTWFRGSLLMDFIFANKKLGYLVVEIIENALLIKTFLLLTHDNTPEGEKHKELTGLSKFDIQYWAIDRISTFANSDLGDNEELKSLFEQAGCGNLLNNEVLIHPGKRGY